MLRIGTQTCSIRVCDWGFKKKGITIVVIKGRISITKIINERNR